MPPVLFSCVVRMSVSSIEILAKRRRPILTHGVSGTPTRKVSARKARRIRRDSGGLEHHFEAVSLLFRRELFELTLDLGKQRFKTR